MKNLYAIDGLINAYTLRKIQSLEDKSFDILAIVNTKRYEIDTFISAIKNIIFPLVCDRIFIIIDEDWVYFRNWNLRKKIELEILKSGLSDDLLRGYRDIYLNPFTSGVSAVLSTKGTRTSIPFPRFF